METNRRPVAESFTFHLPPPPPLLIEALLKARQTLVFNHTHFAPHLPIQQHRQNHVLGSQDEDKGPLGISYCLAGSAHEASKEAGGRIEETNMQQHASFHAVPQPQSADPRRCKQVFSYLSLR